MASVSSAAAGRNSASTPRSTGSSRVPRRHALYGLDVAIEPARRATEVLILAETGRREVVGEAELGQAQLKRPLHARLEVVATVGETAVHVVVGDCRRAAPLKRLPGIGA